MSYRRCRVAGCSGSIQQKDESDQNDEYSDAGNRELATSTADPPGDHAGTMSQRGGLDLERTHCHRDVN